MENSSQGDATKTASEVAMLATDAVYNGFIHNYNLTGKFIIPVLVPMMKSSKIIEEVTKPAVIAGTKNLSNSKVTRTNYVSIPIPLNLVWKYVRRSSIRRFSINPRDTNLYINIRIPKNTEFVIGFIGEDVNKIRVLGINERY